MNRRELFLGLLVLSTTFILGCTGTEIKATITKYEITDFNERPAIKVFVDTNHFPIELDLLGPDKRTIDMHIVESEEDLPAILYFGLSGLNVKAGTYYLILKAGTETLDKKELKLQGPKLQLVKYNFKFKEFLDKYTFDKIELTLKNVGDCPAYVYYIELTIDDGNPLASVANEYKKPILQGMTETYTTSSMLTITKGKHTIRIRISDIYGTVIGDFKVNITV